MHYSWNESRPRTATFATSMLASVYLLQTAPIVAQTPAPPPLDARASDPGHGLDGGVAAARRQTVRFADGSFYKFPQTRWAFSHMRELVPTVASRASRPVSALPRAERADLDAVTFTPIGGASR